MIFEPHNLYGERDPDGNAWPFGYISNEDTPNKVPLPIFELAAMFASRDTLTQTAQLMAAAPDLLAALKRARAFCVAAIGANVTGVDFDPAEHVVVKQIDAALKKAEAI